MIGIAIVVVGLLVFMALAFAPSFRNHESCRDETHDDAAD